MIPRHSSALEWRFLFVRGLVGCEMGKEFSDGVGNGKF
ncbi:MAG: hypothetical protein KatS3mg056_3013 [Chloroflexus sp.]|nr:MAG: hypothetical protein KatS3mg056_3013 [Chloroflexus sp.]